MAEYIERETLRDALYDADAITMNGVKILNQFPSFDVAPVRHGRWDSIPNTYICVAEKDGSYHGNATSCSACNEINPNAYKTNCGAKMDGDGNG